MEVMLLIGRGHHGFTVCPGAEAYPEQSMRLNRQWLKHRNNMFHDIENVKNHFVYQYQHLDDLTGILAPTEVYRNFGDFISKEIEVDELVEEVKKLLLKNGWEGDGDIGLIWLPPFIDVGIEDTLGTYIWHVKQKNNGISWLASPVELNFERLMAQN
jgi:hypothetical protein